MGCAHTFIQYWWASSSGHLLAAYLRKIGSMCTSEAITFVISLSYRQFLLWPTPDQGLGHPRHTPALDFLLLPSLPPSPPVPLTRPWSPSLSVLSGLPGWGPWCGCLYPLLALTPLCSYFVGVVTRGLPAGGWSWLSPLLAAGWVSTTLSLCLFIYKMRWIRPMS